MKSKLWVFEMRGGDQWDGCSEERLHVEIERGSRGNGGVHNTVHCWYSNTPTQFYGGGTTRKGY
jgi:hypothetical protein